MVEHPAVQLELRDAAEFSASGECSELVWPTAARWAEVRSEGALPCCHVTVLAAPPRHVGLGSGTQLALSVAAGLELWTRRDLADPAELAQLAGRGFRSAIGTHGFLRGGLIVEAGRLPEESLGRLEQRLAFPSTWRFVLVRAGGPAGLHGTAESQAFEQLPPVRSEVRARLIEEVHTQMLPALARQDILAFGESLYRFGRQAGECFAPIQGGPYNGSRVTALAREIRELGVAGVGQSSWGPTLFCVVPDAHAAQQLVTELSRRHPEEDLDVCVTAADNQGFQARWQG
jgi:beta-RFAP synthase